MVRKSEIQIQGSQYFSNYSLNGHYSRHLESPVDETSLRPFRDHLQGTEVKVWNKGGKDGRKKERWTWEKNENQEGSEERGTIKGNLGIEPERLETMAVLSVDMSKLEEEAKYLRWREQERQRLVSLPVLSS